MGHVSTRRLAGFVKLGAPLGATIIVASAAIIACGKDGPYHDVSAHPTGGGTGDSGSCAVSPGVVPDPTCDGSIGDCSSIKPGCVLEAKCGDKNTCLPMSDNTGKTTYDLRIRRLNVLSPAALAQAFVEKAIVDQGVNLPACGENGDGSFNWLARIDTTAKTFKTGGAPPSPDPFGVGYCFGDTTSGSTHVQPVTAKYTESNGLLSTEVIEKLAVPIWIHGDRSSVVILPLSKVKVQGVQVSTNGNCIGAFNYAGVNADCSDNRTDCPRWKPHGALGGFITLKEADEITLADLGNKSLCVMLTGQGGTTDTLHCPRDASGNLTVKGDYCSSPEGPGGCADSYWLAATFAASAVHINDGSNDTLCQGGVVLPDGGSDAAPGDAASDAPTD